MAETSARFAFPLLLPGQAQKELFHNEALATIDGALHPSVQGIASAPPGGPAPGESWVVGSASTGEWAGREQEIATWTSGGWRFVRPVPGMTAWDAGAGIWRRWTGASWSDGELPVTAIRIGGLQVLGARRPGVPNPAGGAIVDAEARAAIDALIATLKSHGLTD